MVSPAGTAAKKLVFALDRGGAGTRGHVDEGGGAAKIVGDPHHCAAMQAAIAVGQFLAHHHLCHHPVARDLDQFEPHQPGEGRLLRGDRLDAQVGVGVVIGIHGGGPSQER